MMKRILITCATGEIGCGIASLLAEQHNELVLTARNPERLASTVQHLPSPSGQQHGYAIVDFSTEAGLSSGIHELGSKGTFDDLVLLLPRIPPSTEVLPAADSWQKLWQNVFVGPLELIRHFISAAPAHTNRRKVVIISGISSTQVVEHYAANNAIRAAWIAQAKTLAFAYGPQRIHFNTLSLGGVMTKRYTERLLRRASEAGRSLDDILAEEVANVPLRKYATIDEVAHAVQGMLSEFTDHMTGQNFMCEGGFIKAYSS